MHKAGSSILNLTVKYFASKAEYEICDIAQQSVKSDESEKNFCISKQYLLEESNKYFGVFRGAYVKDMPSLYNLNLIVHVRNPLDCLVSAYYSFSKSHRMPPNPGKAKIFEEWRKKILEMSIDDYVLQHASGYSHRLKVISKLLEKSPKSTLVKYEDMILNTSKWCSEVTRTMGLNISSDTIENLKNNNISFDVPEHEDTSSHKRSVLPGDHLRKISFETILMARKAIGEKLMNRFEY